MGRWRILIVLCMVLSGQGILSGQDKSMGEEEQGRKERWEEEKEEGRMVESVVIPREFLYFCNVFYIDRK